MDDSVGRYFGISQRNEVVHNCGGCNARYFLADIEYEEKDSRMRWMTTPPLVCDFLIQPKQLGSDAERRSV